MKILIIDDNPDNIESSKQQTSLFEEAGHSVTVIEDFAKAFSILYKPFDFDIGLFDLWMPINSWKGSMTIYRDDWNPVYNNNKPEQLPSGLVFALKFLQQNKKVGIVTDSNHHLDWICAMLDLISVYSQKDTPQNVYYFEARGFRLPNPDYDVNIKDWFAVFNLLLADKNPNPSP